MTVGAKPERNLKAIHLAPRREEDVRLQHIEHFPIERKRAIFHEREHRDGSERLRDAGDSEKSARLHGDRFLPVRQPKAAREKDRAAAPDRDLPAGNLQRRHVRLHRRADCQEVRVRRARKCGG